jgi:hypothetical protein
VCSVLFHQCCHYCVCLRQFSCLPLRHCAQARSPREATNGSSGGTGEPDSCPQYIAASFFSPLVYRSLIGCCLSLAHVCRALVLSRPSSSDDLSFLRQSRGVVATGEEAAIDSYESVNLMMTTLPPAPPERTVASRQADALSTVYTLVPANQAYGAARAHPDGRPGGLAVARYTLPTTAARWAHEANMRARFAEADTATMQQQMGLSQTSVLQQASPYASTAGPIGFGSTLSNLPPTLPPYPHSGFLFPTIPSPVDPPQFKRATQPRSPAARAARLAAFAAEGFSYTQVISSVPPRTKAAAALLARPVTHASPRRPVSSFTPNGVPGPRETLLPDFRAHERATGFKPERDREGYSVALATHPASAGTSRFLRKQAQRALLKAEQEERARKEAARFGGATHGADGSVKEPDVPLQKLERWFFRAGQSVRSLKLQQGKQSDARAQTARTFEEEKQSDMPLHPMPPITARPSTQLESIRTSIDAASSQKEHTPVQQEEKQQPTHPAPILPLEVHVPQENQQPDPAQPSPSRIHSPRLPILQKSLLLVDPTSPRSRSNHQLALEEQKRRDEQATKRLREQSAARQEEIEANARALEQVYDGIAVEEVASSELPAAATSEATSVAVSTVVSPTVVAMMSPEHSSPPAAALATATLSDLHLSQPPVTTAAPAAPVTVETTPSRRRSALEMISMKKALSPAAPAAAEPTTAAPTTQPGPHQQAVAAAAEASMPTSAVGVVAAPVQHISSSSHHEPLNAAGDASVKQPTTTDALLTPTKPAADPPTSTVATDSSAAATKATESNAAPAFPLVVASKTPETTPNRRKSALEMISVKMKLPPPRVAAAEPQPEMTQAAAVESKATEPPAPSSSDALPPSVVVEAAPIKTAEASGHPAASNQHVESSVAHHTAASAEATASALVPPPSAASAHDADGSSHMRGLSITVEHVLSPQGLAAASPPPTLATQGSTSSLSSSSSTGGGPSHQRTGSFPGDVDVDGHLSAEEREEIRRLAERQRWRKLQRTAAGSGTHASPISVEPSSPAAL